MNSASPEKPHSAFLAFRKYMGLEGSDEERNDVSSLQQTFLSLWLQINLFNSLKNILKMSL